VNTLNICAIFSLLLYILLSMTVGAHAEVDNSRVSIDLPDSVYTAITASGTSAAIAPILAADDGDMANYVFSKGYDPANVKLIYDYGDINANTAIYADENTGQYYAVISELPMVNPDKTPIGTGWVLSEGNYTSPNNTFRATVTPAGQVTVAFPYHDVGIMQYQPTVSIDGVPIKAKTAPQLLAYDYFGNPNYTNNCLIWDYGVCVRILRQIEGQLQGRWVFNEIPANDIVVTYNQSGGYKLALGPYAIDGDTERITPDDIEMQADVCGWPVVIGDTLTVYPDANPETDTVDGRTTRYIPGSTNWDGLHDLDGTHVSDSNTSDYLGLGKGAGTTNYLQLSRMVMLFDTSALPDDCVITGATLSGYVTSVVAELSYDAYYNVYESNPASNTSLAASDYNLARWGDTPLSTAIISDDLTTSTYNDWTLNDDGLAIISKTGITKLGFRLVDDATDTDPSIGAVGGAEYIYFYMAEQGAGYKPKLYIVYTEVAAPSVTTQAGDTVTYNSFNANGTITAIGTGTPSQRGFCYTTSGTPTTANDTVSEAWASGTGAYSLSITGLTADTTYYYRAYAVTTSGTGYGDVVDVTTPWQPPSVVTGTPTAIAHDKAAGHGTITVVGSGTPSQRGLCWSHTGTPTTDDWIAVEAWAGGTGAYTLDMLPLAGTTTYYVRAYVTLLSGSVTYGDVIEFMTADVSATGGGDCTDCEADVAALNSWLRGVIMELTYWAALLVALAITVAAYHMRNLMLQFTAAMFWTGAGIYMFLEPPWDNTAVGQFFAWPPIMIGIYLLFMIGFQLFAGERDYE